VSEACLRCGLPRAAATGGCRCRENFDARGYGRSGVVPQIRVPPVGTAFGPIHESEYRTNDLRVLRESSKRNIESGIALLALAGVISVAMLVMGGRLGVPLLPAFFGVLRLVRGLRERRESSLTPRSRT